MSFLQLVLSLDKTKEEIILLWRICQFDRYRNTTNDKITKFLYIKGILINRRNNKGENAVDFLLARLIEPHMFWITADGHRKRGKCNVTCLMVIIAAGENVDPGKRNIVAPETRKPESVPEALPTEGELQFCLKHICRDVIRTHLLDMNPHENLFVRVPKLHLPSLLERYNGENISRTE